MAARVADGLGLFKHIASSSGPITSGGLASLSGGEELLISRATCGYITKQMADTSTARVLRPLATIGFVNEVDEQTWEATPITKAMAMEEVASGHRMV